MREGVYLLAEGSLDATFQARFNKFPSVSRFPYMSFTGYWHRSLQSFKEHEHYTFCGFVMALPKWETNVGVEMTCV